MDSTLLQEPRDEKNSDHREGHGNFEGGPED
jgi:hypothetical protein